MKLKLTLLSVLISLGLSAQKLEKIEPPTWWKGMNMDTVEFMVYGSGIHELEASSKTLNVISTMALESPNWMINKRRAYLCAIPCYHIHHAIWKACFLNQRHHLYR